MKNILFILLGCFLLSFAKTSYAQDGVNHEVLFEHEMEYYLTNLELNEEQKMRFSELFRKKAYEKIETENRERSQRENRGDVPIEERWNEMEEEEAHQLVMQEFDMDEREFQTKREFQMKLMGVIGAKNMLRYLKLKEGYNKQGGDSSFEEGAR